MTIDDIDVVFGFANGMKAVDDVEIKGLTAVFGDKLAEKPVVELKEVLGESRAAAATTAASCSGKRLEAQLRCNHYRKVLYGMRTAKTSPSRCVEV